MIVKGEWVLKKFAKIAVKKASVASISLGLAVVLIPTIVMAEAIERPWKKPAASKKQPSTGFFNFFSPKKKPPAVHPGTPVPGTINIVPANPKKPPVKVRKAKAKVKVRKKKPSPAKALTQKPLKSKPVPVKTVETSPNKEAVWWETVGNPAVFAFRDCSVGYAKLQANKGNTATAVQVITAAMKSSCQVEFAKMAGVLVGGLGEKKSNAMLAELAKTTFLPSVKIALAVEKKTQIAKVVRVTQEQKLETAKANMFRCFSERTDRLTVAKNTLANTIADAVLAGCKSKSDAFFDLLLANSKASPQVKQQQKNIALDETYKIAIIRRVMATRKPSQVKTAIQQ